jgi:hypothetical protein
MGYGILRLGDASRGVSTLASLRQDRMEARPSIHPQDRQEPIMPRGRRKCWTAGYIRALKLDKLANSGYPDLEVEGRPYGEKCFS